MDKTIRAQSPPFLGRLKLPPTLRTRPRFTTWTIRNRRPTRERWSVVVNGYGVVSHSSGLPIKKSHTFLYTLNQTLPEPNLNPNQTSTRTKPLNPNQPYPNQTLPEPNPTRQLKPYPNQTYPNQTQPNSNSNSKLQTPKTQTSNTHSKAQSHNPNPNNSTQTPITQHPQ